MNFIINKDQYLAVKSNWKRYINSHSPVSHIAYNILRGFEPSRGFTKITNPNKLCNGASAWSSFDRAKKDLIHRLTYRDARTADGWGMSDERRNALSKEYGVEFTPELITSMLEKLK